MVDVFFSYSNEDKAIVEEITNNLEKEGFTTWNYERDLDAFAHQIVEEARVIQECKAFLIIVSPSSIVSDEVDDEIHLARNFRKPILPVLHKIDYMKLKQNKPEWILIFRDINVIPIPPQGANPIVTVLLTESKL